MPEALTSNMAQAHRNHHPHVFHDEFSSRRADNPATGIY